MSDIANNNEELNNEPSSKNNKVKSSLKFARVLLLLIMAVSALALIFANRDKISFDNFKRLATKIDLGLSNSAQVDNAVIDFDYDSSSAIAVYKDGFARVTSDNLIIMDNRGTQFQSVLTGFNTPAIVTTDKYVLTYDQGGNRLVVTNSFEVLFDASFDDNIVYATMNDNGYTVVITESNAYKNKLTVFDSSFKEIYKINSLNRYFLSADISYDNKYIAISSLYVKGNSTVPQIVYYKLTQEEALWEVNFEDSVAVLVNTKADGSISAVFEWGVCVLDSKGKEKFRYEYNNKILQNCHVSSPKYNVAVTSDSLNGNSEILVFNNRGKEIGKINVDYSALSIDLLDDRLAVLSRDKIYVYSVGGKLLFEKENSEDGSVVKFIDKNSVFVISASSVIYNIFN